MSKNTGIDEYDNHPEFNEIPAQRTPEEYIGIAAMGTGAGSETNSSGRETGLGIEDVQWDQQAYDREIRRAKRKKLLMMQALALSASAAIAVSTTQLYPVSAKTRVAELSDSTAVVQAHFSTYGSKEGKLASYILKDTQAGEIVETGEVALTQNQIDFKALEPEKAYEVTLIYEDRVIKKVRFQTLTAETEPETPPETRAPETKAPETRPPETTEAETETETETETEPETPAPTTEPETTAPPTKAPTRAPETTAQPPSTEAAKRLEEDTGTSEYHTTIIYTQDQNTASSGPGPNSLPVPETMTVTYGSASAPFAPIINQMHWDLGVDASMYMEWSITSQDTGKVVETHKTTSFRQVLDISQAVAEIGSAIGQEPRTLSVTPCYQYKGSLVKQESAELELPYLKGMLQIDRDGTYRTQVEGTDSLTAKGLTMTEGTRSFEKQVDGSWVDASADFAQNTFTPDISYRVVYRGYQVTSTAYGQTMTVPDFYGQVKFTR